MTLADGILLSTALILLAAFASADTSTEQAEKANCTPGENGQISPECLEYMLKDTAGHVSDGSERQGNFVVCKNEGPAKLRVKTVCRNADGEVVSERYPSAFQILFWIIAVSVTIEFLRRRLRADEEDADSG